MKTALGIIGAIALAIFVGYINSINHRKNRFAAVSAKFRNVFINELKEISPIPVNWSANIDEYLRSKFVILQAAIKEFGDLLPWHKRFFFYKAWVRYYCCTGRNVDKNCQVYHHYMASSGSSYDGKKYKEHDNTKSYQENFKKNIDKLLSYAKAK